METGIIIQKAIEQLEHHTGAKIQVNQHAPDKLDAVIKFKYNNQAYLFYVEAKKELRNHQLPQLEKLHRNHRPLLVIAEHLFPKIKEELRHQNIAYLETNGNAFIKEGNLLILLEGQKADVTDNKPAGRAFTKTGLKVVFHFLLHDDWINLTYREIAQRTGVGFGNINIILTDLKEQGFLIQVDKDNVRLTNKKALLEKWMIAYDQKLKPALYLGAFRFLKDEDFLNWQKVPLLPQKTMWGGEPAGDLLTKYLNPAELTIYTEENRKELITRYRLVPDDNGKVKVYQKFWQDEDAKTITPPLLVYADLMMTGDRRCIETAQKIYDAHLQNQF